MPTHSIAEVPQEVREMFEALTLKVIAAGFRRYSADAILHRIRWTMHVERGNREFKCNNNWTAALARWFVQRRPEHSGFFELRNSPGARTAAGYEGRFL